jgi:hypothetical protein
VPSPAVSPTPSPSATPKAPTPLPPLRLPPTEPTALEDGWVKILESDDTSSRAWVEGEVAGDDKLTINTKNVRGFELDLTRLRLNWNRGVVLRLDGYNSELTRKRWPRLVFVRNASGAWVVEGE